MKSSYDSRNQRLRALQRTRDKLRIPDNFDASVVIKQAKERRRKRQAEKRGG